jgi:hypothetical protein
MYNSDFLSRFEHSVRFSVVQLTFVYQQRLIFVKKRKRMVRVGRYIFSEQKETLTLFPENEKKKKKYLHSNNHACICFADDSNLVFFFVKFKERPEIKTAASFSG